MLPKINFKLLTHQTDSQGPWMIVKITEISETAFKGVITDYKLSWKPHITYINDKVAKGIMLEVEKAFICKIWFAPYVCIPAPEFLYPCIECVLYSFEWHLFLENERKFIFMINGDPPGTNTEYFYTQQSVGLWHTTSTTTIWASS